MADATVLRPNKGFHPVLERDHPFVFVDACMQAWPDADFGNCHRHGATAFAVTAFRPHDDFEDAVEGLMYWHLVARRHDNVLVATTADDIRHARRDGRAALIMHAQGGDFIANKIHRVEAMFRLGLRMMLFAYNSTNAICDGALDRTASGLTRFGETVVDECNRLGLLIDCSHLGERASLEVIARSASPVTFSHSNCLSVSPSPRNITDEQIRACTERGGVIGLAPFGPLVLKQGQTSWPTLDDFIDHIDHVAQVAGTSAHIGIGTDMSIGTYPDHWHDPWGEPEYLDVGSRYAKHVSGNVRSPMRALKDFNSFAQVWNLIDRLRERGFEDTAIEGILGGNYLRLFDQVWPSSTTG